MGLSFLSSCWKSPTKLRMLVTGPRSGDLSFSVVTVRLTALIFSWFSLTFLLGMLEVD